MQYEIGGYKMRYSIGQHVLVKIPEDDVYYKKITGVVGVIIRCNSFEVNFPYIISFVLNKNFDGDNQITAAFREREIFPVEYDQIEFKNRL